MEEVLLTFNQFNKKISKHQTFNNLSFTVQRGQILGIIGENNSGKSRLCHYILKYRYSKRGGLIVHAKEISIMPESPLFYSDFSGWKNLKLLSQLNYPNITDEQLVQILKVMHLYHERKKKVRDYSLGMRVRLSLALALVSQPDLLIIDEPFTGLDTFARHELIQLLKVLAKQGIGILLTTNHLTEAENLCTDIIVLADGKISEVIDFKEISKTKVATQFKVDKVETASNLLKGYGYKILTKTEDAIVVEVENGYLDESIELLVQHDIKISTVTEVKETLSKYFVSSINE